MTTVERISPFQVEIDNNQIAIVRIDVQGKMKNWLPEQFVEDLRDAIGTIIYQQAQGVILVSGKKRGFIQGYDPDHLRDKTDEQLKALSNNAQLVMREINTLKMPVVAVIDGPCFGVGLELALACDYRIASEESYTKFAMPQIRSGILPFAGGDSAFTKIGGLTKCGDNFVIRSKNWSRKSIKNWVG